MRARGPGPALPRDRAVLIRLARHRVLSLAQVHSLVFAGLDRSRASRRITALVRAGWATRWDQPVVLGGRPGFVVPTAAGLRWALDRIVEELAPFKTARLVATMLRRDGRRPLPFTRNLVPPFFEHLHDVNVILASLLRDPHATVLWASSWNRPFPNAARHVVLPQPDAVLVTATEAGADLVFLEHDRGGESLEHFRARKVDRYRELAQRPALLAELTGFESFHVCVTVRTGDGAKTADRVEALRRCIRGRLAEQLLHVCDVETGAVSATRLISKSCSPDATWCDTVSQAVGI